MNTDLEPAPELIEAVRIIAAEWFEWPASAEEFAFRLGMSSGAWERALCRPLRERRLTKLRRAGGIIFLAWWPQLQAAIEIVRAEGSPWPHLGLPLAERAIAGSKKNLTG